MALALAAGLCACGKPKPARMLAWTDVLGDLTNTLRMARLDVPGTRILTSFDPTGGNDDFNHYVRPGPKGWIVLADLKGPACMTRFWFTGGSDDGSQRIQLFFDGEKTPRIDMTMREFCGGKAPFLPPLAVYENYCWFNLYPLPFNKSLVIMTQEGGYKPGNWPRLFYQINHYPMPPDTGVESFDFALVEKAQPVLAALRQAWLAPGKAFGAAPLAGESTIELPPGAQVEAGTWKGPAIMRELRITPDFAALPTPAAREAVLRNVLIQMAWNGQAAPSVNSPLGDFFGSFWQRTRYESMFFGMRGDSFITRFPMPFEQQAQLRFVNQGDQPVTLKVQAQVDPLPAWDAGWGYFHAAWSRTTPEQVGQPHPILQTAGAGKYVGCMLGVVTLDRSWWILEGDEKMYVDGAATPYWHGTGLEDYFNGGWYYQNVLSRPLHGLAAKTFFRIAQYRLQLLDPVFFQKDFRMTFERGPDEASHGWMESEAFYYLAAPAPSAFDPGAAAQRTPPDDGLSEPSIMTDLLNYERLDDYAGASEYLDRFLARHPKFPMAPMLRLRKIAYVEHLAGIDKARPLYEEFLRTETEPGALEQARLLLEFHAAPDNALLLLACNGRTTALLDGQAVASAERPDKTVVRLLKLPPGKHALSLNAQFQPYPNWNLLALRTHDGVMGTGPDWKWAYRPAGAWSAVEYDDSAWTPMGGTGVKGPPEEPFIWMEPNALVGVQSRVVGIRGNGDAWTDKRQPMIMRKGFSIPLAQAPDSSNPGE